MSTVGPTLPSSSGESPESSGLRFGISAAQVATGIGILLLFLALSLASLQNAEARDRETAYLQTVERTTAALIDVQRLSVSLAESIDSWQSGLSTELTVQARIERALESVQAAKSIDPDAATALSDDYLPALQRVEDAATSGSVNLSLLRQDRNIIVREARNWLTDYQAEAVAELKGLSGNRASGERNQAILLFLTLALSGGLLAWVTASVSSSYRRAQKLLRAERAKVASARAALDHASEQLAHQASHDSLTGLPNRNSLIKALTAQLSESAPGQLTVFFCDLDRFKNINDSLGHGAGDEVLVEVGTRLRKAVGEQVLVGRFGGDEFVVVCSELDDTAATNLMAERITRALSKPISVNGLAASVGVSIGVARSGPGSTASQLIHEADLAMYRAKATDPAQLALFDEAQDVVARRLNTEMELRQAIGAEQLLLHWQPIVNLRNSQVHTLEALLRWNRPGSGLMRPDEFLPIAQDSGLIVDIGRWVLRNACAAGALTDDRAVSVNVSATELRQVRFVDDLIEILEETGLPPARLVLEVTEQTLIDPAVVNAPLRRVRELGARVALDDFGTGYSSLSLLHLLPVDIVKLDRTFAKDLAASAANQAVIKALVQATSALGMQLVVEGVESDRQRRLLRSLGVQHGQGYWFGEPEPGRLLKAKS